MASRSLVSRSADTKLSSSGTKISGATKVRVDAAAKAASADGMSCEVKQYR